MLCIVKKRNFKAGLFYLARVIPCTTPNLLPMWSVIIKPSHPLLRLYILEYSLRSISIPDGQTQTMVMPLWCLSTIDFFLSGYCGTADLNTGHEQPFCRSVIRGMRTSCSSYLCLRGQVVVFNVKLTPNGLHSLFAIPAYKFTDRVIDTGLMCSPVSFTAISRQLADCHNIDDCVAVIEPHLLKLLRNTEGHVQLSGSSTQMLHLINSSKVPQRISSLKKDVYISQRQLQNLFLEEIGTTPKRYSRMVRFTNMVYQKVLLPGQSWASLAYEFGYCDQRHLIGDFRYFLGITPGQFVSDDFHCIVESMPASFFLPVNS